MVKINKDPSGLGLYPLVTGYRDAEGKYHRVLLYKDANNIVRRKQMKGSALIFLAKMQNQPLKFSFYQHVQASGGDTIPDGYKIKKARFVDHDETWVELVFEQWRTEVTGIAREKWGITSRPGQIWDWGVIQTVDEVNGHYPAQVIQIDVEDFDKKIVLDVLPYRSNQAFPGPIEPSQYIDRVARFINLGKSIQRGDVNMNDIATSIDGRFKKISFPASLEYRGVIHGNKVPKLVVDIGGTGAWGPGNKETWKTTEKINQILLEYVNNYPGLLVSWGDMAGVNLPKYYIRIGGNPKKIRTKKILGPRETRLRKIQAAQIKQLMKERWHVENIDAK